VLIWLVKIIDRRVVQVRDTLKAAAANTADTALIRRSPTAWTWSSRRDCSTICSSAACSGR
jgi:hypothetical protein